MATYTPPVYTIPSLPPEKLLKQWKPTATVPLTIHRFPSLEPIALENWSVDHLYLPLRRDLLHLAICYEGDSHRQGTASSKNRWEVHGSHRKMRPQKGTGRARAGDRMSPIFRGGGKPFGPHPRDFSTRLPKKVYDKAWRTALSWRYRRGGLLVCEDGMDLSFPHVYRAIARTEINKPLREAYLAKYMTGVLDALQFTGRTLFVTGSGTHDGLFQAMQQVPKMGRALPCEDVDVKDLLETRRVVMERSVLCEMLKQHQSDLVSKIVLHGIAQKGPPMGVKVF